MRIVVTGGAGFIGSTVVDAYVDAGHDVAIIDDLSTGSEANVSPRARWYRVDLRSADVDDVIARERPEVVSHQAAQVSVKRSVDDPRHDADVNVLGSITLLEAARRHGVRRVIAASTGGAIYGEQEGAPADEDHPCRPMSPYAVAKLSMEHYLRYFTAVHGLETIVLRYANVYGPRQDPHGEAGVIAIFIKRILAGLVPTIYGDGEQVRDFVHVSDVVRANVHALSLAGAGTSPTFNIATGRGSSVNTLWRLLRDIAGTAPAPVHEPERPGDVRRSVLDPSRARKTFGWEARVDLATGLRDTWEWFRASGPRSA
jgi:UDP-glucose 4-epimerase